jgi:L-alanine-DL-glutamate epimerase-like enolase superfamily enzyme
VASNNGLILQLILHPRTVNLGLLSDDPEGTAKEGKEYVKQGYRAVKYGWGKTRERAFGMNPDKDEEMIRTIREVLGPDIRIMVDVGRFVNLTLAQAVKL